MIKLRPFQKEFIKAVQSDTYDVCALSVPRGNGKSFLSAQILLPYLKPDSKVFNSSIKSWDLLRLQLNKPG